MIQTKCSPLAVLTFYRADASLLLEHCAGLPGIARATTQSAASDLLIGPTHKNNGLQTCAPCHNYCVQTFNVDARGLDVNHFLAAA